MSTYLTIATDGTRIDNRGQGYVSADAARKACARQGKVPAETRRTDERQPDLNDATGWDAYRLRRGIAAN